MAKSRHIPPQRASVGTAPRVQAQIQARCAEALALHRAGRLEEAEALYRTVLRSAPDHPDALSLLGLLRLQAQDPTEAASLLQRAVRVRPGQAEVHADLGDAQQALGQMEEALTSYRQAAALKPGLLAAQLGQALLLERLGRGTEALTAYDAALATAPGLLVALHNKGVLLSRLGRPQEGLESLDRAMAVDPASAPVHSNRAVALLQLRRPEEALAHFRRALALAGPSALGHTNIGNALRMLDRTDEALAAYADALALQPDFVLALSNRAFLLHALGRLEEADPALEQLLAVDPHHAYAAGKLLSARLLQCDWRDHDRLLHGIEQGVAAGRPAVTPLAFLAMSPDAPAQLACASIQAVHDHGGTALPAWAGARPARSGRLRVAYVSADFRDHAMAYLMAGVFERHRDGPVEAFALSLTPAQDTPLGRRLQAAFSRFIDVSQLGDEEVTRLMRDELGIDVAVDLMGLTQGARPGIFAQRVAPVQVNYLGHPGTTGTRYNDYILADRYLVPVAEEPSYGEAVVRLPSCFQANDERRVFPAEAPPRTALGLPEAGFVFCSFHAAYKLHPDVFDLWMDLLRQVDGSVLWLVADRPQVAAHLADEARARGVDPARLVFAPRVDYAAHLARLQAADLVLDTFPFNAGTTASDALWAGVPLVTRSGSAYAARMAGSLLQAAGLAECITADAAAYETLALELARTPARLAALRQRLAAGRRAPGGLFDTGSFTQWLEAAYVEMYARFDQSLPPAGFDLPGSAAPTTNTAR
jgi:protein O-GlcNAc transferase